MENSAAKSKRLAQRVKLAGDHQTLVKERYDTEADDSNKDRTQYFEKISLGCGATVAAIVSFVGSHPSSLHPHWLLRSSLISFVLALAVAQARNFHYPYYILASRWAEYIDAGATHAQTEYEYVYQLPLAIGINSGNLVDKTKYQAEYLEISAKRQTNLQNQKRSARRHYIAFRTLEFTALGLVLIGFSLLISLTWLNF